MPTQTRLLSPLKLIPTVQPHLMPFHIEYSGPAPVSTYFHVKPDLKSDRESVVRDDDDESNNKKGELDTDNKFKGKLKQLKQQVISAFRGRRLKGVVVDVPEGYTGIVLQAGDEPNSKATSLPLMKKHRYESGSLRKNKRMVTRNSTLDAENDIPPGPELETGQRATETKVLRPMAKFNSITIWNPDANVDDTYDEYIRTLDSYRRLLAEIHQNEPSPVSA